MTEPTLPSTTEAPAVAGRLDQPVRRLVVARFPIPRKAFAVVTMPANMSAADMDMLTGMVGLLAGRFKQHDAEQRFAEFWRGHLLPRFPMLGYSLALRDGAEGRPDALRSDDCTDGSIPQAPNV